VLLRDDLPRVIFKHRQSLALMAILDVIGLLVLLLQLTTGGFPQNVDDAGMRFDGKLVEEVWFSVILAASFFPVAGFVGAVAKWRAALWVYALYLVSAIGFRIFLTFEVSFKEGLEERRNLLIDEALFTLCILFQLQALQVCVRLAVYLDELVMQVEGVRLRRNAEVRACTQAGPDPEGHSHDPSHDPSHDALPAQTSTRGRLPAMRVSRF